MKLVPLLKEDAEGVYRAAEGLFKKVDPKTLNWKPATGSNWMTVGQLLHHASTACGNVVKGFVTGDWGAPAGDSPPDDMMPSADKMASVKSVEEALKRLAEDKKLAMAMFEKAGEKRLAEERSAPPWGGPERTLYQHCNEMIWHLGQHKGQLFYYLKLQGKDVNTMSLWAGM